MAGGIIVKKILFLIIDMQNGFVNKYTEGLEEDTGFSR